MRVRDALDWLTTTIPALEWHDVDGIPNVRPKDEWNSADDLLNLELAPLQASQVDVSEAVMEMFFGAPSSGSSVQFGFDLRFPGGRVIDGLNALIRNAHAAGWDAISIAHPTNWPDTNPVAVIGIRLDGASRAGGTNFWLSAAILARRR